MKCLILSFVLAWLYFPCSLADEVTRESRRTVIMDYSEDLQVLVDQLEKLEPIKRKRTLSRLVRLGADKLIAPKDNQGIFYVNARNYALKLLIEDGFVEDQKALKAFERAGNDWQRRLRLIERYPNSLSAFEVLSEALKSSYRFEVARDWIVLIQSSEKLKNLLPRSDEQWVAFPASEIQPLDLAFKVPKDGEFSVSQYQFFDKSRYPRVRRTSLNASKWKVPPNFLLFDTSRFILSDFHGLVTCQSKNRFESYVYQPSNFTYKHFDNNLIADVTRVGDWVFSSQQLSPMKMDSQKNLYVVELSKHQICGFRLDQLDFAKKKNKVIKKWIPNWKLSDKVRSFNSSVVVRGDQGFATSSFLSGLFNHELVSFDIHTGKLNWRQPMASGQQELNYFGRHIRESSPGIPLVTQNRIYVSSNVGTLHAFDLSGKPLWVRRYNRIPNPVPIQYYAHVHPRLSRYRNQMPRVLGDYLYVSPTDSDSLLCLNKETGEILWEFPLYPKYPNLKSTKHSNYPHSRYFLKVYWHVSDSQITLVDLTRVHALDPKSGKVIKTQSFQLPSSVALNALIGRPLFCANKIVLAASGHLLTIDRKSLQLSEIVDLRPFDIHFNAANAFVNGQHFALIDAQGILYLFKLSKDL